MKLLPRREPRQLEPVRIDLGSLGVDHRIHHTYDPKPRPVMLYGEVNDDEGRMWKLSPQSVSGNFIVPVSFPLAFVTGRPQDNGRQVTIRFRLEY
jgi:hypothetical protein